MYYVTIIKKRLIKANCSPIIEFTSNPPRQLVREMARTVCVMGNDEVAKAIMSVWATSAGGGTVRCDNKSLKETYGCGGGAFTVDETLINLSVNCAFSVQNVRYMDDSLRTAGGDESIRSFIRHHLTRNSILVMVYDVHSAHHMLTIIRLLSIVRSNADRTLSHILLIAVRRSLECTIPTYEPCLRELRLRTIVNTMVARSSRNAYWCTVDLHHNATILRNCRYLLYEVLGRMIGGTTRERDDTMPRSGGNRMSLLSPPPLTFPPPPATTTLSANQSPQSDSSAAAATSLSSSQHVVVSHGIVITREGGSMKRRKIVHLFYLLSRVSRNLLLRCFKRTSC